MKGKQQRAASFLARTRLGRLLSSITPGRNVLVLNYHRIGDGSTSIHDRGLWSASTGSFDQQLRYLKLHCDVIGLDEIDHARRTSGGRHVAITFDDGYLDNYQLAYPLLRMHRLPAAFFITTGFIDDPRLPWWDEIALLLRRAQVTSLSLHPWRTDPLPLPSGDREQVIRTVLQLYKALPADQARAMLQRIRGSVGANVGDANPGPVAKDHWMDWSMIREMAANGMTIGGHTVHHPVLSRLPPSAQQAEIRDCATRLREELDQPMDYFAYPVGDPDSFDAATRRCLVDAGVRLAFSYYGGVATALSDRYDMPRVSVDPTVGIHLLQAMTTLPHRFCPSTHPAGNRR